MPERTRIEDLHIIPSAPDLVDYEQILARQSGGQTQLAQAIAPFHDQYDFIFIDSPPSLAMLPINALRAATDVMIPLQCEYYAMEGLGQILQNTTRHPRRGSAASSSACCSAHHVRR